MKAWLDPGLHGQRVGFGEVDGQGRKEWHGLDKRARKDKAFLMLIKMLRRLADGSGTV